MLKRAGIVFKVSKRPTKILPKNKPLKQMLQSKSNCNMSIQTMYVSRNPNSEGLLYHVYKPFFIVAHWFALFLVRNVQLSNISKPTNHKFMSLLSLIIIVVQCYDSIQLASKFIYPNVTYLKGNTTKQICYLCLIIFDRFSGISVYLYAFCTSKKLVFYFDHWKNFSSLILPKKEMLRKFSIQVTLCNAFLAIAHTIFMSQFRVYTANDLHTWLKYIWTIAKFVTCFLSNYSVTYIQMAFVLFAYALLLGFKTTSLELKTMFLYDFMNSKADNITRTYLNKRLTKLRLKHQELCMMVKHTNELFSPALLIVIISIAMAQFGAIYGLYIYIRDFRDSHVQISIAILYIVIIKIGPLAAICFLGQKVATESAAGILFLYHASSSRMTEDTKLQIQLLESKLNSEPAILSASGFLKINYKLFLQIAGVAYTYSLVMIQNPT